MVLSDPNLQDSQDQDKQEHLQDQQVLQNQEIGASSSSAKHFNLDLNVHRTTMDEVQGNVDIDDRSIQQQPSLKETIDEEFPVHANAIDIENLNVVNPQPLAAASDPIMAVNSQHIAANARALPLLFGIEVYFPPAMNPIMNLSANAEAVQRKRKRAITNRVAAPSSKEKKQAHWRDLEERDENLRKANRIQLKKKVFDQIFPVGSSSRPKNQVQRTRSAPF